jgi:hypothetical protein
MCPSTIQFIKGLIEILKAIAWPALIFFVFWRLRKPLFDLLSRLSEVERVKVGSVEAVLRQKGIQNETTIPNILNLSLHDEVVATDSISTTTTTTQSPEPSTSSNVNDSILSIIQNKLTTYLPGTINQVRAWIVNEINIDNLDDINKKAKILEGYSEVLYLGLVYERIYNDIYGTQIKLLDHLTIVQQTPVADLDQFYTEYLNKAKALEIPPAIRGEYLEYLSKNNLITNDPRYNYSITDFGRDFLGYLISFKKFTDKAL